MTQKVRSIVDEFKKFALRGNLIDLAIGFTVGASFSTVAKSLVNDILMPPVGLVLGNADFSNLFFVIKGGNPPPPYATPAEADMAGAITLNYGNFINNLLSLIIVAIAMFLIIKVINKIDDELAENAKKDQKPTHPSHKKCPFCFSTISYRATRCPECTSKLEVKK